MNDDQRSICPFCSMGCSLLLRSPTRAPYVGAAGVPALGYDADAPVNRGSLCAKGNMALELLTHPARLESPRIRNPEGELVKASWEVALEDLGRRLKDVVARHGSQSIGLLLGPTLTNEEVREAAAFARALGTPHVDLCQPEDHVVLEGLTRCGGRPQRVESVTDIERATAILVAGDLFTMAPCIAKPVLHARYDNRQNVVGTLGFWKSRTYLFGKPALRCLAGREAAALALILKLCLGAAGVEQPAWAPTARTMLDGLDLEEVEQLAGLSLADLDWLASSLRNAEHGAVLFGCGYAESERLDLAAGLSALVAEATGSRFLAMVGGPNTFGIHETLRDEGLPPTEGLRSAEMLAAAGTGELKGLLAFGCDPVGAFPGVVFQDAAAKLPLLATTAPLMSPTAETAHVVLPAGTWGEKAGGVKNAFGHDDTLAAVMRPPGTARTDSAIFTALHEALGKPPSDAAKPTPLAERMPAEAAPAFFHELELYLRLEGREERAREIGTHWLFPEAGASHASDGWLTGPLSWPAHEAPGPVVALSPGHARDLGVKEGDRVRVRSRDAEARLAVRIEQNLVGDVVLVPPHHPETRRLTGWRLDGIVRDLDLRPERVTVEALEVATGEEEA